MSVYSSSHARNGILKPTGALCLALLVCLSMAVLALPGCRADVPVFPPAATDAQAEALQPRMLPFTLTGEVAGALQDGDEIQLWVDDSKYVDAKGDAAPMATTRVENGRFTLSGEIPFPTPALLRVPAKGYRGNFDFILEQATYSVTPAGPDLVITGGRYNNAVFGFVRTTAYIDYRTAQQAREDDAFKGLDRSNEAAVAAAVKKAYVGEDMAEKIKTEATTKLIENEAADPMLRLFALGANGDYDRFDFAKRFALLQQFEKIMGKHAVIDRQRMMLTNLQKMNNLQDAIAVGGKYKDVSALDASGKPMKLSATLAKHKVVLLDFWASWCGPCRDEFPHLARLRRAYGNQLEVFSISQDEDKTAWLKALKEESAKHDVSWVNLIEVADKKAWAGQTYGVLGLPDNYLIAADGTVLGKQLYREALDAALEKKLGKAPASAQ